MKTVEFIKLCICYGFVVFRSQNYDKTYNLCYRRWWYAKTGSPVMTRRDDTVIAGTIIAEHSDHRVNFANHDEWVEYGKKTRKEMCEILDSYGFVKRFDNPMNEPVTVDEQINLLYDYYEMQTSNDNRIKDLSTALQPFMGSITNIVGTMVCNHIVLAYNNPQGGITLLAPQTY